MKKYIKKNLLILFALLTTSFITSCDSEYFDIDGYEPPRNTTLEKCEDGTETICENDPVTHSGYLVECKDNKIIRTRCDNGYSCDANGKRCGKCLNDTNLSCKNDPDSNIGYLTTCNNGVLEEEKCPNAYSCDGNSCGECRNGQKEICTNDETTQAGSLKTCSNGRFQKMDCMNSFSCNGDKCGECTNYNTTTKCIGTSLGICNNGKFVAYTCSSLGATLASCASVADYYGCLGTGFKDHTCIQDDNLHEAYLFNNIEIAFTLKKFCPTHKCNADFTGCEGDPLGGGEEGGGDEGGE